MITSILSNVLTTAINNLGYNESLRVIKSNRPELCDYQCDDVFKLVKIYHKSPIEIGNEIVEELKKLDNFSDYFEKVEFCNPGFINITVSNKCINDSLISMDSTDKFNLPKVDNPMTYVIDYGGPNVAKPLHVGHLRPAIVGESIKRIIDYVSCKASPVNILANLTISFWLRIHSLLPIGSLVCCVLKTTSSNLLPASILFASVPNS